MRGRIGNWVWLAGKEEHQWRGGSSVVGCVAVGAVAELGRGFGVRRIAVIIMHPERHVGDFAPFAYR